MMDEMSRIREKKTGNGWCKKKPPAYSRIKNERDSLNGAFCFIQDFDGGDGIDFGLRRLRGRWTRRLRSVLSPQGLSKGRAAAE